MNFRPMLDRILVDQDPAETTTASGFILHHEAAEAVNRGTVLAVGPGKPTKNNDAVIPVGISVGERVLYAPGSGLKVRVEGVDYLVLKEEEVIAIVEDR
jgi:chaperonin GroES